MVIIGGITVVKALSFQQVGRLLSRAGVQGQIASAVTKGTVDSARKLSVEAFGFDFTGLFVKLLFFFAVNFAFAKLMEAVVFGSGLFATITNLFGFQIPDKEKIPDSLKKLFDGGINGFKFWDIVKLLAILLVIWEYFNYIRTQKALNRDISPLTTGVFVSLIAVLGIATAPELIKRIKTTDFNLESLK